MPEELKFPCDVGLDLKRKLQALWTSSKLSETLQGIDVLIKESESLVRLSGLMD